MNSLYGRFGMNLDMPNHNILDEKSLKEFIRQPNIKIINILDLQNDKFLISYVNLNSLEIPKIDKNIPDVSVSISSAISAYSRIHMSIYLGDPNIKIWATDTDSLITDSILPTGNELGELKLEAQYKEASFIAPKVYGGILTDNTSFTKVKGFKNSVPYNDLKSLLIDNSSLELTQDKWFKHIEQGNISPRILKQKTNNKITIKLNYKLKIKYNFE